MSLSNEPSAPQHNFASLSDTNLSVIQKQLKEMMESGRVRPELLKTHKQRVEELNAHLSRLSEHHDMPKIGPG